MNARLLPTLVAILVCAFPAAAVAQSTDPATSDYTPTLSTQTATPTPTPEPEPEPTPAPEEEADVEAQQTTAEPVAPAATQAQPAPARTGTTPETLAYTGSETWLVALVGMLALAGGVALMRTSRRA